MHEKKKKVTNPIAERNHESWAVDVGMTGYRPVSSTKMTVPHRSDNFDAGDKGYQAKSREEQ